MTITLESITVLAIFHFILIFCRIGALIVLLPGVGEVFVPVRVRLLFALAVTYVLFPLLAKELPPLPENAVGMAVLIGGEITIGVMIGGITRLLQSIMHTTGMIMAFLSSLAAAQLFDATQGSQGSVYGNFLSIIALTLFFVADLHHLILEGMVASYQVFLPGNSLPFGEISILVSTMLSEAFLMAFKLAAPQVIIGMCMYLGAGVMGRLMPAMQVFFILVPIQVVVSFNVLLITVSMIMMLYISHFEDSMNKIFYP